MVLGATYYGHKIAQQMQSDADERGRHFNALQEAEARTRSILDTAADGIVSFDEQGRIEVFNKAAEHLFGQDSGQTVGVDIRSMIPAMAEYIDAGPGGEGQDSPAAHAGGSGSERVGLRRDGTEFPLELSVSKVNLGHVRTFTAT